MSVGSRDDKDEIIDRMIVVKLPGYRKSRIAETGGEERVEQRGLVRAIPVGPRSGERSSVVGEGEVRRGRSSMFSSRGRGGRGRGFMFGMEGYGYRGRGRGTGGYYN